MAHTTAPNRSLAQVAGPTVKTVYGRLTATGTTEPVVVDGHGFTAERVTTGAIRITFTDKCQEATFEGIPGIVGPTDQATVFHNVGVTGLSATGCTLVHRAISYATIVATGPLAQDHFAGGQLHFSIKTRIAK